jgi:hypothetical protein
MKTIINKFTGQLLYATVIEIELLENEIAIDELLTEYFENPYFDFESRTFYNKE